MTLLRIKLIRFGGRTLRGSRGSLEFAFGSKANKPAVWTGKPVSGFLSNFFWSNWERYPWQISHSGQESAWKKIIEKLSLEREKIRKKSIKLLARTFRIVSLMPSKISTRKNFCSRKEQNGRLALLVELRILKIFVFEVQILNLSFGI